MDTPTEDVKRSNITELVSCILNSTIRTTSADQLRFNACSSLFLCFSESAMSGMLLSMSEKLFKTLEQPMFRHDEATFVKETTSRCIGELGSGN
jgi:hypothetical protein